MARLQKSFQDYFKIPILLKPVGQTPQSSIIRINRALNSSTISLAINETYEPIRNQFTHLLEKRSHSVVQVINFRDQEYENQYSQFEVMYRCRFVVGVYDESEGGLGNRDQANQDQSVGSRDQTNQDEGEQQSKTETVSPESTLAEKYEKLLGVSKQEKRKVLGLLILTASSTLSMTGLEDYSFMIIPEKLQSSQNFELGEFLEPWLYTILAKAEEHVCRLIDYLQSEDNNATVFNKNEERTDPKLVKRKKKGRCLKICGDFFLLLHLTESAFLKYNEASEILRKLEDWLWVLGCAQGKLACFTTDFSPEGLEEEETIEQTRLECMEMCKKIRVPALETQNYFKILKIFTSFSQKFDEMATSYVSYISTAHSDAEQLIILPQLASLYKQAGMGRKSTSLLFQTANLVMGNRPEIANVLLLEILKEGNINQWQYLLSTVLKLIIQTSATQSTPSVTGSLIGNLGYYYFLLLTQCWQILSPGEIRAVVGELEKGHYEKIELPLKSRCSKQSDILLEPIAAPLTFSSIKIHQSDVRPKLNRIGASKSKPPMKTGLLISWRNKENICLFQQNQHIPFAINIFNNFNVNLRIRIQLHFIDQQNVLVESPTDMEQTFILKPLQNNCIKYHHKFGQMGTMSLTHISVSFWHFWCTIPVTAIPKMENFKIQIYEEYPQLQMGIGSPTLAHNETIQSDNLTQWSVEENSCLVLPICIRVQNGSHCQLGLSRMVLSVAVYYHVDTGFQETKVDLTHFAHSMNRTHYFTVLPQSEQGQSHKEQNVGGVLLREGLDKEKETLIKIEPLKQSLGTVKKLELKLEAIRSQQSKYQVGKQISINIRPYRAVQCQLLKISTPIREILVEWGQQTDVNVIEDVFLVWICFRKKVDDLTPYSVYIQQASIGKQTQQINQQYLLSNETEENVMLKLSKHSQDSINDASKELAEQQNRTTLKIYWRNANTPSTPSSAASLLREGKLTFQIPFDEKYMSKSSHKQIQFDVSVPPHSEVAQASLQKLILINRNISINYEIKGRGLDHEFRILQLEVPSVKRYVLRGKTKLKEKQRHLDQSSIAVIENRINVEFVFGFPEKYLLQLKFEDGSLYVYPCVFEVHK